MLRPIFAVLPLDIHSLCYRARVSVWGSADAALGGVQRFSPATARLGFARVLRPVAALPGCVRVARAAACGSTWQWCVQRFWRRFSCEIRLGASLGFVCVPRAGVRRGLDFLTRGDRSKPESRVLLISNSGGVLSPTHPKRGRNLDHW